MFEAMAQAGVRADHVSYNILIDAFGRAGLTAGTNLTYWQASIVSICKLTYTVDFEIESLKLRACRT